MHVGIETMLWATDSISEGFLPRGMRALGVESGAVFIGSEPVTGHYQEIKRHCEEMGLCIMATRYETGSDNDDASESVASVAHGDDKLVSTDTIGGQGEEGESQGESVEAGSDDDGGGGEEDDESDPPMPPRRGAEGGDRSRGSISISRILAVVAVLTCLFILAYLSVQFGISMREINAKIAPGLSSLFAVVLTFVYKELLWLDGKRPRKDDRIEQHAHHAT